VKSKNIPSIEERTYAVSDFLGIAGPIQKISLVDVDDPKNAQNGAIFDLGLKNSIVLRDRIEFEKNFFESLPTNRLLEVDSNKEEFFPTSTN